MNHAEQLRQLRAKATAGEWEGLHAEPFTACVRVFSGTQFIAMVGASDQEAVEFLANGALITYAANNALAIADALDAKDTEIKRLRTALANLVSSHDGYHLGVGPCICDAHNEARTVLGVNRDNVKVKEPSE